MKPLYWISLLILAVVSFVLAAKAGRDSIVREQRECEAQGGTFINNWRHTAFCRVKGDAR